MKQQVTGPKELWQDESGLKQILSSIGEQIALLDEDLTIIWANDAARGLFGDHLIGNKCYEVFHGKAAPCEPQPCIAVKAFQDGQIHQHETEVTDQYGRKRMFHCTASGALNDMSGKVTAVVEISRDITHQHLLKKELRAERDELELQVQERTTQLKEANHQLTLEIEKHKQTEYDLGRREAIIEAVHVGAVKFLQKGPNESIVREALAGLGNAVEASRVYVYKKNTNKNGAILTSQLCKWLAPGTDLPANSPDLDYLGRQTGLIERWVQRMKLGHTVVEHVGDFPLPERQALASLGICSIILVPIFVENKWWGFIGFDDCRRERSWSDAEVNGLKTAADMIGATVQRHRQRKKLIRAETRYRQLVELSPDLIAIIVDGRFTFINQAGLRLLGATSPKQIIGESALKVLHPPASKIRSNQVKRSQRKHKTAPAIEQKITRLDGKEIDVELVSIPFPEEGSGALQIVARDLTVQKLSEVALKQRETILKEQSRHLEEANTALKVLLRQREQDNKEFGESILHNVQQIILPHIERLEKRGLNAEQASCIEAIKLNLERLISPFAKVLSSQFSTLTPTEIQIAKMIRRGCRTKEMSENLGIAETTILFHRQNIRNKLGLKSSKINLQSYLRSIE